MFKILKGYICRKLRILKVLGIIPARYGSTRLEGKPLLDIAGKSMIRRVYENAKKSQKLSHLVIATDHNLIFEECSLHQIPVLMTHSDHLNGTERCGEVVKLLNEPFDIIINIQGDEPFIHGNCIDELVDVFLLQKDAQISTLVNKVHTKVGHVQNVIGNPSIIKVVTDVHNKALYFSRSVIPFPREIEKMKANDYITFKKHIGIYGFRKDVLLKLLELKESALENIEKLEQLRWLENGYSIYVAETDYESKSIDTKEDYHYIIENISKFINE